MATSKAITHRHHDQIWWTTPTWLERLHVVAMWMVLISIALYFVGLGFVVAKAALDGTPYFKGGGVEGAVPLGFLATFMTFSWLPAFMPLLLPVALFIVLIALPFAPVTRDLWTHWRQD